MIRIGTRWLGLKEALPDVHMTQTTTVQLSIMVSITVCIALVYIF